MDLDAGDQGDPIPFIGEGRGWGWGWGVRVYSGYGPGHDARFARFARNGKNVSSGNE